jgi:hypothetical protein
VAVQAGLEEIDRAARQVRRYWYVDGLKEIAIGAVLLGCLAHTSPVEE